MANDIRTKAYLGSVVAPRYTIDNAPTEGSGNLVTSGGVYDALADVKERLLVHVDFIELLNTGTGTADATAAEIYEASKSKDALLVAGVEHEGGELIDGATLTLVWATSEFAVFSMVEPASGEPISTAAITYYVTIKADGTAVACYAQSAIPQVIITVNASTGKADIKPGEIYNRYGVVPVFVIDNHYTGAYGVYPYLPVTCITPTDIWYGGMVKTDSNGVNYYSVGHIDSTGNVTHEVTVLDASSTTPEPLVVTVTESDGSYASDKTYAEIAAAHEAGRVVEARHTPTSGKSLIYRLARIDPSAEQAYFTTIDPTTPTVYIVRQIGIAATGSVAVTQARLSTQS